MATALGTAVVTTFAVLTTSTTSSTAAAVPRTPVGLTAAVEAYQPYVGQKVCDPAAKPGVSAFRDLLLRTYPASGSLGIVRDCGSGGTSEHKEGRAFDWANDAGNATDAANVNALLTWMMKTDQYGNANAMVRRTGLMYVIWNRRIWKAYDPAKGWQPYSGASAHTDHVHFSFGWNGARKNTSYWTGGRVAAVDPGPAGGTPAPVVTAPQPVPQPAPQPVRQVSNVRTLEVYGSRILRPGSTDRAAVKIVQAAVKASPVDGVYGSGTSAAVRRFQTVQRLAVTGDWRPTDWQRMFPKPVDPFGVSEIVRQVPGGLLVRGWAIDADTAGPLTVAVSTTNRRLATVTANRPRPEVGNAYPSYGPGHGYDTVIPLAQGSYPVCVNLVNAAGSPGKNTALSCSTQTIRHDPEGLFESATTSFGRTTVRGWALDKDTAAPIGVRLTLDGKNVTTLTANQPRADVGTLRPGYGPNHGFGASLVLQSGRRSLCAVGVNTATGKDISLGCKIVDVQHTPVGVLESPTTMPGRGTTIRGWALDPDSAAPIEVQVLFNGKQVRRFRAEGNRPSVAVARPGYGAAHGFNTELFPPAGTHRVCVNALNAFGPGATRSLGCQTLTVGAPRGAYERIFGGTGRVLAVGWALDPDRASATSVAVIVDGKVATMYGAAGGNRPDVGAGQPGYGPGHGFAVYAPASKGRHTVCVTARNIVGTKGSNVSLGCKVVTVA